ncbi:MAG: hypothetical protein Q9225_001277 [Loekoesia sp. 1 TL-2023]
MSEAPHPRDDIPAIFQKSHASPKRLVHLIPDELAMLFLSPRNNLEGHLNVLQGVSCQIFLRANDVNIDHILSKRAMCTGVVPALEDLLAESPVDVYPYEKTFDDAYMDPCLVLHTTGSTGLPKPITWKVGILSTYEAWRTIPPVNGYVPTTEIYQQAKRAYTSMPLFHTSGLNAGITWALLLGVTLVYGAPNVVPSASYADEMHKYAGVDASMGAPSIYEELSREPEALARTNRLEYVVASGAPLSRNAGALISEHTRVISNLGATETACLQRLAPAVDDWAYFYWHPTHSGIEMREAIDGLYELFLVKSPELKFYQGIFNTFPDIQEWSMNDLYARHPDPAKRFLYTYRGRKDDVIVLSNGEKITPALIEATLMSDSLVKGAMVVGRGKFQPLVIVDLVGEPPKGPMQRHETVEKLLPVIAEANIHAPAHGKLDQYHILFTKPDKPIAYLGQGKIQRSRTYAMYEKDIEEVYRAADDANEHFGFSNLPRVDFSNGSSVAQWLKQLVAEITGVRELDMHQDLFSAGVDSLQIMKMSRELRFEAKRAGLGQPTAAKFLPSAIYKHPTLSELGAYLLKQADTQKSTNRTFNGLMKQQNHSLANEHDLSQEKGSVMAEMEALLRRYTNGLSRSNQSLLPPSTENMTVILTGSTGSLGSYLLEALQNNKNVLRIICLNRRSDAAERHRQTGPKRGLSPLDPNRVEFLKADLSKPQLGLGPSLYQRLRLTVTHIIRDVSAVSAWSEGAAPEEPVYNLKVAGELGYGQSKLISECLLDKAAAISGVPSACCRVGIVAGPVEKGLGQWNKHEYIPSIIISSAVLNTFPVTFPSRERIDWLPVDKLSKVLVEILIASSRAPQLNGRRETQMYHVVNPNSTSWSSLAPEILALYPKTTEMRPVSYDEWVDALSQSADEFIDLETNPAIQLLEFYRKARRVEAKGSRMLTSHKAENASKTLQRIGAVKGTWIRTWMQQWGLMRM